MQIDLSERQQNAIAAALTILAATIIICAIGSLFWLIGTFVSAFSSVFLSLAVAGVAAMVFRPYYAWIHDRVGRRPVVALVLVFLSVLIPVAAFSWFFGALIVEQISDLVHRAPDLWKQVVKVLKERWPSVLSFLDENPIGRRVKDAFEGKEGTLLDGLQFFGGKAWSAGAGVVRGIGSLLSWAVLPVYLAYFLMADPMKNMDPDHLLPFLKEDTRRDVVYLAREFVNVVVAFFRGQILIAFLQGCLFAIGFSVVGLAYGLVLGLLLGLLNVIPYLGSIIGLSIALPLAMFQKGGGWALLVAVLIVFVVVQLIEGYLLTPKIMGDRTGLHPMAIIVSVFFWGSALNGIMGMILAIPLTAFLVVLWRLAREKYIAELV